MHSNPCRKGTKPWLFLENCNINYETGVSDRIDQDRLKVLGLGTTNGCGWGRSDKGALGETFLIDRPLDNNGHIAYVQLVGYKNTD